MASDRFDDVSFEILEEPESAPRRRHRGLVAVAALIAAGALAGGAAAHTDGPASAATAKAKSSFTRDGHGCRHGGGRYRGAPDSSVRY